MDGTVSIDAYKNGLTSSRTEEHSDSSSSSASAEAMQLFRREIESAAAALTRDDTGAALLHYGNAVAMDPTNHVLYANRSAILLKAGSDRWGDALRDADTALMIKPNWWKAHMRRGNALRQGADWPAALAAYADGLAAQPKNTQLLDAIKAAAENSPLVDRFRAVLVELTDLGLDKSAFVIVSVLGQELLAVAHGDREMTKHAVSMVESALKIGTTSLKLRQSVLSSLSSAYWALGDLNKAADYMKHDLAVATSLGDTLGEARAHANLGVVYLRTGDTHSALEHYRQQLLLSLKLGEQRMCLSALSILGQLYHRLDDLPNALASYTQCIELAARLPHEHLEPCESAHNLLGMGQVHLAMDDLPDAAECFEQALAIGQQANSNSVQARALCQLGRLAQKRVNLSEAVTLFKKSVQLARACKERRQEGVSYGQLSVACHALGQFANAKKYAHKELQVALALKDSAMEGAACGHLGNACYSCGEHENALRLHSRHKEAAVNGSDRRGQLAAQRNIGLCLSALQQHQQAVAAHTEELAAAQELRDERAQMLAHAALAQCAAEHGNAHVALVHLNRRLHLSTTLGDAVEQLGALRELGTFFTHGHDLSDVPDGVLLHHCPSSSNGRRRGDAPLMVDGAELALPHLEKYLMLAQEQNDLDAERDACHLLGLAYYKLESGPYFKLRDTESARYLQQEVAIAKDGGDYTSMAAAYRALGNATARMGALHEALECHKYDLALSHIASDLNGKLCAMANIGRVLASQNDTAAAIKVFGKGLKLARASASSAETAEFYQCLGSVYEQQGKFEKALASYSEELSVHESVADSLMGQCAAIASIGRVHMTAGAMADCLHAFDDRLNVARRIKRRSEAILAKVEALRDIGRASAHFRLHNDAIEAFGTIVQLLDTCQTGNSTSQSDGSNVRLLGVRHRRALLESLWGLAGLYERTGEYEQALHALDRFKAMTTPCTQSPSPAPTHLVGNVPMSPESPTRRVMATKAAGTLWLKLGMATTASRCYQNALDMIETCPVEALVKVDCHRGLAAAQLCQRTPDSRQAAINTLQARLEFSTRLQLAADGRRAQSDLACAYALCSSKPTAARLHATDLRESQLHNDTAGQCRALLHAARMAQAAGQWADAEGTLRRVLPIANGALQSEGDDKAVTAALHEALIEAHVNLGVCSILSGDYSSSMGHLQRALGRAATADRPDCELEARCTLALLHWMVGSVTEALDECQIALRLAECQGFGHGGSVESRCLRLGYVADVKAAVLAMMMILTTDTDVHQSLHFAEQLRMHKISNTACSFGVNAKNEFGNKNEYLQHLGNQSSRPLVQDAVALKATIETLTENKVTIIYGLKIGTNYRLTWTNQADTGLKNLVSRTAVPTDSPSKMKPDDLNQIWRLSHPLLAPVMEHMLRAHFEHAMSEFEMKNAIISRMKETEMQESNGCLLIGDTSIELENELIAMKVMPVLRVQALLLYGACKTPGSLTALNLYDSTNSNCEYDSSANASGNTKSSICIVSMDDRINGSEPQFIAEKVNANFYQLTNDQNAISNEMQGLFNQMQYKSIKNLYFYVSVPLHQDGDQITLAMNTPGKILHEFETESEGIGSGNESPNCLSTPPSGHLQHSPKLSTNQICKNSSSHMSVFAQFLAGCAKVVVLQVQNGSEIDLYRRFAQCLLLKGVEIVLLVGVECEYFESRLHFNELMVDLFSRLQQIDSNYQSLPISTNPKSPMNSHIQAIMHSYTHMDCEWLKRPSIFEINIKHALVAVKMSSQVNANGKLPLHYMGVDKIDMSRILIAKALRMLFRAPDECKEAARMLLHLIEKSIQRIRNESNVHSSNNSNASLTTLYTSERSVRNKVGPEVAGWLDLMLSVGFQKKPIHSEGTNGGQEDSDTALYFPGQGYLPELRMASTALHAVVALPTAAIVAISHFEDDGKLATHMIKTLSHLHNELQLTSGTSPIMSSCCDLGQFTTDAQSKHATRLLAALGFETLLAVNSDWENGGDKSGSDIGRKDTFVRTCTAEVTKKKVEAAESCLRALYADFIRPTGHKRQSHYSSAKLALQNHMPQKPSRTTKTYRRAGASQSALSPSDTEFSASQLHQPATKGRYASRRPRKNVNTSASAAKQRQCGYASESEAKRRGGGERHTGTGYYSEEENYARAAASAGSPMDALMTDTGGRQSHNVNGVEMVQQPVSKVTIATAPFRDVAPMRTHLEVGLNDFEKPLLKIL